MGDPKDCKADAHYDGEQARTEERYVGHGIGSRVLVATFNELPPVSLSVPAPVLQLHDWSVAPGLPLVGARRSLRVVREITVNSCLTRCPVWGSCHFVPQGMEMAANLGHRRSSLRAWRAA